MNLVLLHGFGENHEIWTDFIPLLDKNLKVFCPDYSEITNCTSLHDYANWLKTQLIKHKIKQAVFVGHSMGGYISLEFAYHYPEYVLGLGLFNSTSRNDNDEKRLNRDKTAQFIDKQGSEIFIENFYPNMFTQEFKSKNADLISKNIAKYIKLPKEALIKATLAMKDRINYYDFIQQFTFPIFQIIGQKDAFVDFRDALKQSEKIKNPNILLLSHVAHAGMYESPKLCANFINNFIETL